MRPSVRCPEGWGQPQGSPGTPCAGFASMFPRWPPSEVFLPAPCTPSPAMGGGDPAPWRGDQRPHSDSPPAPLSLPCPPPGFSGEVSEGPGRSGRGGRTDWYGAPSVHKSLGHRRGCPPHPTPPWAEGESAPLPCCPQTSCHCGGRIPRAVCHLGGWRQPVKGDCRAAGNYGIS